MLTCKNYRDAFKNGGPSEAGAMRGTSRALQRDQCNHGIRLLVAQDHSGLESWCGWKKQYETLLCSTYTTLSGQSHPLGRGLKCGNTYISSSINFTVSMVIFNRYRLVLDDGVRFGI